MAQYPELDTMGDDDLFIEGAWIFKGEMPHEEAAHIRIRRMIKKSERDTLARSLKKSYNVNRVDFRSIER
jgi:hypothetical protein